LTDAGPRTGPQYSDDKQWWWTGTEWVPASQAPAMPGPASPPVTPAAPPRVQSPSTTSGGFPRWLVVVAAFLFFPITVVVLIIREREWSIKRKAVLIGGWIAVLLVADVIGNLANAQKSFNASYAAAQKSPVAVVPSQRPSPVATSPSPQAQSSPSPSPKPSPKPSPSPTPTPPSPSPLPSPTSTPTTASFMTRDSGVYGIPLPRDAVAPDPNYPDIYASSLDTIANYTNFYHDWMLKHGWIYEPNYSWTDPSIGVTKQTGYGTNQVFCVVGSSPIRTVIIDVQSKDGKQDQGKLTRLFVADDPGESSCP
jgi:hypothetical protein